MSKLILAVMLVKSKGQVYTQEFEETLTVVSDALFIFLNYVDKTTHGVYSIPREYFDIQNN